MKLIKNILIFFFFLLSLATHAQLDKTKGTSTKGKKKLKLSAPAKIVKKPKTLDNNTKDGFKSAFTNLQKEEAKKQKERELENKGILTTAKIAEERYLNSWKRINAPYPVIDQDLGSFRTSSESVKIICRDFQYPDGDRVTIFVNDIPVVRNITLRRAYQGFVLPLTNGMNKIAFKALNQGTSGPNTASFKVFDDKGNALSSNEWFLATGAKATILIAKED